VKELAPKPVNVLWSGPGFTVAELADLGVRRISVGGALARTAWGAFLKAAREIAEAGSFAGMAQAIPNAEMNGLFAKN
jgi:methylisocitrate lyase